MIGMSARASRGARHARRLGFLAVGILTAASWLPAAQPAHAASTISLTFWSPFSGPDGPAMQKIVSNFNASHSGIKINMTINPNGNYNGSLTTAISARRGPNIFVVDDVLMATYASAGVLAAIDQQASAAGLKASDFDSSLWNGGNYNGKQYAIPMDALPLTMYWNKAVFKNAGLNPDMPPTNEATFVADAQKMTKGNVYGFIVPPNWPQPFVFPTLLAQFGGAEMNVGKQQVTFNAQAGIQALNLMHDWIYKYHISPPSTATDYDITALTSGKSGMIVDGPWQYSHLHSVLGANLGVSSVPQWGSKKAVFLGQHYLALSKATGQDAGQTAAALTFAKYFEDNSILWAQAGDLPAYKPTMNSPAFKALSYEVALAASLPYGVLNPKFPNYANVSQALYAQISLVLLNKKDAASALAYAAQVGARAIQSATNG